MKTEKRHHRKIIKTREEVEMMKNGLTNVFSVQMTNHAERMNFMECRRTLKEILEGVKYRPARRNWREVRPEWRIPKLKEIHNQPVDEKFSESMLKWKIPKFERTHNKIVYHKLKGYQERLNTQEIQRQNKTAITTLTKEVQLTTSLINQNVLNNVGMETTEHMMLEELWYKIEDTYFTSKEIVIHTQIIRTTKAEEMMDHG